MAYANQHFELFTAYKRAHPELRPQQAQINTNVIWNNAKKEFKRRKPEMTKFIEGIIGNLNRGTGSSEAGVAGYVPQVQCIQIPRVLPACSYSPAPTTFGNHLLAMNFEQAVKDVKFEGPDSSVAFNEECGSEAKYRKYNTPAQEAARCRIALLESELNSVTLTRNSGLRGPEIDMKVHQLHKSLAEERQKLTDSEIKVERQKKRKTRTKASSSQVLASRPDGVCMKEVSEQRIPRVGDPPEMVRVAAEIALFGGFVDMRTCQELVRRCNTVEDIDKELHQFGLRFEKCGSFMRLISLGFSPDQGLRFETAVPVNRFHAQTQKDHVDHKFCSATINSVECLASILGSKQVAVLSQDCRASVPLAITAAGKKSPMLMRMEYDSSTQFAPAHRNKLYLSVYGGLTVRNDLMGASEAVEPSGPTYIAIRTGSQLENITACNAMDLERIMWLTTFHEVMRVDGKTKPVLILTLTGGPDESPRYPSVIKNALNIFKKYELDALYVMTGAPAQTVPSKMERRLALLSRELFGIVLPHDHYCSHLNECGAIVDEELEKRNMEYSSRVLCDIWSRFVIDGHPVVAEYIAHKAENCSDVVTSEWYCSHVRESKYFLQIVKCANFNCCTPMRSSINNVLPNGFFAGPYPIKRTPEGLRIPNPSEITWEDQFASLLIRQTLNIRPTSNVEYPYDEYCPSARIQIYGRTCHLCGLYFASKKSAAHHVRDIHKTLISATIKDRPKMVLASRRREILCLLEDQLTGAENVEWLDEQDVDLAGLTIPETSQFSVVPVIGDTLGDWLQLPWLPVV